MKAKKKVGKALAAYRRARAASAPGEGARFKALKGAIEARGGVRDAGAAAASIGRKKYGKARMALMAARGRRGG